MPLLNIPYLLEIGLMAVVFLFSVVIHEVAHGYVALQNGDPTAKIMGRLTLNPGPHIDLMGSILLPGLLLLSHAGIIFGWAKPVPVNPLNYRHYRWGEITVSAAGPLSNLALAVVFAFILRLIFQIYGPEILKQGTESHLMGLMKLAFYGVEINIILALFNLIPIPPLDGSHILAMFLPANLLRLYRYLDPVGIVLIFLLLRYTGIGRIILLLADAIEALFLG